MKIGFIGAGNMGSAILKGIACNSFYKIAVYEKSEERAAEISAETGAERKNSVKELIASSDVILIAVKPVHIDALISEIKTCEGYESKIYVSIAAGVKIERFTNVLGNVAVVRTMPNLPAMVGEGLTGMYFYNMDDDKYLSAKEQIVGVFEHCGKVVNLPDESYVDKIISVTSSSPAYICIMIDALADGAVRAGFSRKDAYIMAEQTVYGTAKYLLETGTLPAVLKDMVCSPAGTTIEAVASLEKSGFRGAIFDAMEVCENKALGKK